jgi:hypothetical protein
MLGLAWADVGPFAGRAVDENSVAEQGRQAGQKLRLVVGLGPVPNAETLKSVDQNFE